jgi:syntaxin 8
MSAGKLTSLATSTLSLLLERQRLQASHPTLHLQQISTNLHKIREGVIILHNDSNHEAAEGLTLHYERLRGMLGEEEAEKVGLHPCVVPPVIANAHLISFRIPAPMSPSPPPLPERDISPYPTYEPYTDDPSPEPDENGILLQQRQMMDGEFAVKTLLVIL